MKVMAAFSFLPPNPFVDILVIDNSIDPSV